MKRYITPELDIHSILAEVGFTASLGTGMDDNSTIEGGEWD